jgi:CheY-like chemotaxis protein
MLTANTPKALCLRILVVDDSPANRKVTKRLLTTHGHQVVEAVDGLDCLKVVRESLESKETIDLILMDSNMPNMNGLEATKVLRDINYTGTIFGVTGDVDDVDIAKFLSSGANDVLAKPLQMTILKAKLGAMFYAASVTAGHSGGFMQDTHAT